LLEGFGFAPTSFIRLGLFREGDFAVLTDPAVLTDFLANATPSHHGNQLTSLSPTLSRNAACASS
jgi:hypothetical protein